jgi:hypothetical protein
MNARMIGVVIFLIGAILAALELTFVCTDALLFAGLVVGALGFILMFWALKTGENKGTIKIIGIVALLVGAVLTALGVTVVTSQGVLFAGIVVAAIGFAMMYLSLQN